VSEKKKEKKRTANKGNPAEVKIKTQNSHLFDDPNLFLGADAPEED
jgi:hypothetical protein